MGESYALEASAISVRYGNVQAVTDARIVAGAGSITAIVGPNGAGKSSLFHALIGAIRSTSGEVAVSGRPIAGLDPTARAKAGLVLVPQGRQVFPRLTVQENLLVMTDALSLSVDRVAVGLNRFPVLHERRNVPAGTLSGGEQQMLVLARALMTSPKVLLLDEPMLGLAPVIVEQVVQVITQLAADGIAVIIAEPSVRLIGRNVHRGYVMIRGKVFPAVQGLAAIETEYLRLLGITAASGPDARPAAAELGREA